MEIKPIYRFRRADGGVTDSLTKPECEYTERVRMLADQGKRITKDGERCFTVIDADSADGFYEVDASIKE